MEQYNELNSRMEAENHFKNRAKLKSNENIITRAILLFVLLCLAGFVMTFSSCKKDDPQRKLRIIDIPAEYNEHNAFLYLINDNYHWNTMSLVTITNGEVTTKITDYRDEYIACPPRPLKEDAEFYVKLQILESMNNIEGTLLGGSVILSVKSDVIIPITKEITTISFKTLTKEEPRLEN